MDLPNPYANHMYDLGPNLESSKNILLTVHVRNSRRIGNGTWVPRIVCARSPVFDHRGYVMGDGEIADSGGWESGELLRRNFSRYRT